MSSESTEAQEAKPHMDTGTRLAYDRTYLANERTQMAWVRTTLALISFGFGIAKFFQYLQQAQGATPAHLGPRTVGMLMIAVGLVALAFANVQHRRAVTTLQAECPGLPHSTAGALAAVIMVLGILAFVGTLL